MRSSNESHVLCSSFLQTTPQGNPCVSGKHIFLTHRSTPPHISMVVPKGSQRKAQPSTFHKQGHGPGMPMGLGPSLLPLCPGMCRTHRGCGSSRASATPSPTLSLCHMLWVYRTCPTRTDTGMRPVSNAFGARAHWWTSPSLPRRTSCCARTATPTSTPPSVRNARRPSCQVRNAPSFLTVPQCMLTLFFPSTC